MLITFKHKPLVERCTQAYVVILIYKKKIIRSMSYIYIPYNKGLWRKTGGVFENLTFNKECNVSIAMC